VRRKRFVTQRMIEMRPISARMKIMKKTHAAI
jgi:hypothetical protein